MPTATHITGGRKSASKSKSTAKRASSAKAQDAIQLLKADHRAVEKLFSDFQKAGDDGRKRRLAEQICLELRVHTQIEEEIFYPSCREALESDELIDEALVEHAAAKDLIEEIEGMQVGNELYAAKVNVLREQIERHVEQEEKQLFPKVLRTDMDIRAIGEQLAQRKMELMAQMGGDQGLVTH